MPSKAPKEMHVTTLWRDVWYISAIAIVNRTSNWFPAIILLNGTKNLLSVIPCAIKIARLVLLLESRKMIKTLNKSEIGRRYRRRADAVNRFHLTDEDGKNLRFICPFLNGT